MDSIEYQAEKREAIMSTKSASVDSEAKCAVCGASRVTLYQLAGDRWACAAHKSGVGFADVHAAAPSTHSIRPQWFWRRTWWLKGPALAVAALIGLVVILGILFPSGQKAAAPASLSAHDEYLLHATTTAAPAAAFIPATKQPPTSPTVGKPSSQREVQDEVDRAINDFNNYWKLWYADIPPILGGGDNSITPYAELEGAGTAYADFLHDELANANGLVPTDVTGPTITALRKGLVNLDAALPAIVIATHHRDQNALGAAAPTFLAGRDGLASAVAESNKMP